LSPFLSFRVQDLRHRSGIRQRYSATVYAVKPPVPPWRRHRKR